MKKKKKFQNQQIILNQDIVIKFYLNFLTFSSLNSFRLKYYYYFLRYFFFFNSFTFSLFYNFKLNFFLTKIISANYINLHFSKIFESFLLQKFVDSKNLYLESYNNISLNNFNNFVKVKRLNSYLFNNYTFSLNSSKDSTQNVQLIKYSIDNKSLILDSQVADLNMNYYLLQQLIFYLIIVDKLNLLKILILLNLLKIHK